MTEKMDKVAKSIEDVIRMDFPDDYLSVVFEHGLFEMSDIVNQIMVECCKHAYDATAEKYSLLHYFKNQYENPDEEDNMRKQASRTLTYINKHRDLLRAQLLKHGIDVDGLQSPDMNTMAEKLEGYKLTPFQFWEITDVHDNPFVKAIVDKRIFKKNHFTIDEFLECERLYNEVLKTALKNIDNDIDVVENFLKIFIIESKYSFDFYYALSQCMIINKISSIYDCQFRLISFSRPTPLSSAYSEDGIRPLSQKYGVEENRLIRIRLNYTLPIVKSNVEEFKRYAIYYNEARYIVAYMLTQKPFVYVPIKKWFLENTNYDDWKSVFLQYGIQNVISLDKEWSATKAIRYIKKMYESV